MPPKKSSAAAVLNAAAAAEPASATQPHVDLLDDEDPQGDAESLDGHHSDAVTAVGGETEDDLQAFRIRALRDEKLRSFLKELVDPSIMPTEKEMKSAASAPRAIRGYMKRVRRRLADPPFSVDPVAASGPRAVRLIAEHLARTPSVFDSFLAEYQDTTSVSVEEFFEVFERQLDSKRTVNEEAFEVFFCPKKSDQSAERFVARLQELVQHHQIPVRDFDFQRCLVLSAVARLDDPVLRSRVRPLLPNTLSELATLLARQEEVLKAERAAEIRSKGPGSSGRPAANGGSGHRSSGSHGQGRPFRGNFHKRRHNGGGGTHSSQPFDPSKQEDTGPKHDGAKQFHRHNGGSGHQGQRQSQNSGGKNVKVSANTVDTFTPGDVQDFPAGQVPW